MHEDIFPVFPLNKSVALGCVKPLHCAFFFHLLLILLTEMHRPAEAARKQERGLRMDSRNPPSLLPSGNQEPNALPLYNMSSRVLPAKPPFLPESSPPGPLCGPVRSGE